MGKNIDLSHNGGFPWFDDYFDYLQTAYTEMCVALAKAGGAGPHVISGCTWTRSYVAFTTYTYAMSAGWIFYNGELVRVPGNSVNVDESVDRAYISLVRTSAGTAMAFYDGSTPNVINDVTGVIVSEVTGTGDTGVLFALSELAVWGHVAFTDLPGGDFGAGCSNAGGGAYNVGYRVKDNMVDLCGLLAGSLLGISATLCTLPVAARPASTVLIFVYTGGYPGHNMITINTDGTVVFDSAGGSGTINLDGVRFRLS